MTDNLNLPTLEIRPAYWYTCEECGTDGWVPLIVQEIEKGAILSIPEIITCQACGTCCRLARPLPPSEDFNDA